ncbi:molybdenum cofactor guanylyltransferase MobA [Xinfangfangia sp. CPCC 101601]|uniref:Molybdenum cofactor guanylyltransferase n=1 Tax=Pseudogemmobacter lacusdianii TaxID=3069608 RepID=A0ABU0VYP0_9RHOB|nr:molybdenum cofactor guanylyltransferase MobA [Xinfangfangia sp. CPCC 101601]MDQ2066310.1 molybdenum cofactor guanylyltransferase MobA [Xinfangfangia sp. CPCC 101601]
MRIFGIILAGGEGRRMGSSDAGADKALLPLAGRPLLAHLHERLAPQVEELAVSANGDAARFAAFNLPVLPDTGSFGPLSGVLAGLQWAQSQGADAVVSAPVDAPFVPQDLTPRLLLAAGGVGPALARSGGRLHPTCGLWPVTLIPALAAFLASGVKPRVTDFAHSQGAAVADFPDDGAFTNLNTREDLAAAEARITGAA